VHLTSPFHPTLYPRNGRYCAVWVITERANGVFAESWLRDCCRRRGTRHFGRRCGSVAAADTPGRPGISIRWRTTLPWSPDGVVPAGGAAAAAVTAGCRPGSVPGVPL